MKKGISIVVATVLMLSNSMIAYAESGDAFCVGCDMAALGSSPEMSTVYEASRACEEFCKGTNLKAEFHSKPTSDLLRENLDSTVVYLAAHGSMTDLSWPYASEDKVVRLTTSPNADDGSDYYSIYNKTFDNIDFAIIAACKAGMRGGVADFLAQKGAETTFGWTGENVENAAARDYGILMADYLSDGYTIVNAVTASTADMVAGEGDSKIKWDSIDINGVKYPDTTKSYFQTAIYGDLNNTLTNVRSVVRETITTPSPEITIYPNISGMEYEVYSYELDEIANYIKENIDSYFDLDLFACGESEVIDGTGNSIMTFRYKVGDYISDFGYNVVIVDNEVKEIVRVGESLYNMPATLSSDSVESKFDVFKEKNEASTVYDTNISNVDYIKRFDSKTKEYFVRVVTTYEYEDGTTFCEGVNVSL